MDVSGPRVREVSAAAYRIPTDRPEADGTLAWDATTLVTATVRAGDAVGLGWTYGSAAAAVVVEESLSDTVVGRPVSAVRAAHEAMRRAVRNTGRTGVAATALSAVDLALWDCTARLSGVRLARLLGAARDSVPVYGSGGFTTYDDAALAAQLDGWAAQGITRFKIKIGESWGTRERRDLERVANARSTIGPEAELFVDANGAYGVTRATRVARGLAEHGVSWFEEPVSSDDLTGLHAVRTRAPMEITAGEYGYDPAYFERMCAADAVDCLQADVTRCGGVTGWLGAADVAGVHHLDLSAHCAPAAHLDAALATPNLRHQEWFHDHTRIEAMLFDGVPTPVDGEVRPDWSAPGNGVTPRPADAEPYRIR